MVEARRPYSARIIIIIMNDNGHKAPSFYLIRGEEAEVVGRVGDHVALAGGVERTRGVTKPREGVLRIILQPCVSYVVTLVQSIQQYKSSSVRDLFLLQMSHSRSK